MNIDLHYYTSCYKLAAYETIRNSSIVNEIDLSDELKAKTYWFYFENDLAVGDVSEFIVEFYKEEELLDRITFHTNPKRGKILERCFDRKELTKKMKLVKELEPSIPIKLFQHKPKLNREERNLVISRVNELEYRWYQIEEKKKTNTYIKKGLSKN